MEYKKLGNPGPDVSRIGLGCVGSGDPARSPRPGPPEEASRPVIRHALDLGIDSFDTADVGSPGVSEEVVGAQESADVPGFKRE